MLGLSEAIWNDIEMSHAGEEESLSSNARQTTLLDFFEMKHDSSNH